MKKTVLRPKKEIKQKILSKFKIKIKKKDTQIQIQKIQKIKEYMRMLSKEFKIKKQNQLKKQNNSKYLRKKI